jgi:hypothetical protein
MGELLGLVLIGAGAVLALYLAARFSGLPAVSGPLPPTGLWGEPVCGWCGRPLAVDEGPWICRACDPQQVRG